MTVLKQYNTSTSTWDTVVVGQPGEPGIVTASSAPADTSVLWMDTADTASQVAIPSGGTAGQILAKTSGTDYATGWVDEPGNRNVIINGGMDIWQRGTSFTNLTTYAADRWLVSRDGSTTVNASQQTFTPGSAPVAGYEGQYFMRLAGTVVADSTYYAVQRIEDVRTFAGQTATLSFWAKSSTPANNYPLLVQAFGSGGSGSVVVSNPMQTIGTSWQRYTTTFTVPSISGKTIGSSSVLEIQVIRSNTSATIDVWGVQFELGSLATPFKRNTSSLQAELAACQRYYVRFNSTQEAQYAMYGMGPAYATTGSNLQVRLPVTMRVAPTSIEQAASTKFRLYDGSGTDRTLTSALTLESVVSTKDMAVMNASSSSLTVSRVYTLSNNNDSSGFIGFSAEL